MSPTSFWSKTLLPLWGRWLLSGTSMPGAIWVNQLWKNLRLWCWHQPQSYVLMEWIFLFLPMFLPTTGRREEKITWTLDSLTNCPGALKPLLIALWLCTTASSPPTWKSRVVVWKLHQAWELPSDIYSRGFWEATNENGLPGILNQLSEELPATMHLLFFMKVVVIGEVVLFGIYDS